MERAALNLNVHFHCVIPDGVFVHEQSGGARFVSLSEPPDGEVKAVLRRIAIRLLRLLRPRLQAQELEQLDPLASAQSEALLLPIGSLAGPSSTSATARSSMASRYTPVSTCTQTIAKASSGSAATARGRRSRRSA